MGACTDVRVELQSVERLPHAERSIDGVSCSLRVDVEEDVVRRIRLVAPARPHVQVDGTELHHPEQPCATSRAAGSA
jgi:hypothetical protein